VSSGLKRLRTQDPSPSTHQYFALSGVLGNGRSIGDPVNPPPMTSNITKSQRSEQLPQGRDGWLSRLLTRPETYQPAGEIGARTIGWNFTGPGAFGV